MGLCTLALLGFPALASAVGTGAIEGEVTGPGGSPVDEAWACAYLVSGEEFEEDCDFTEGDGLYSIGGLAAGSYKVEFWSESVSPSYVGEYYDDKAYWEEADEVGVVEGAATTGIDAQLDEGATIEGRIDAASVGGPVEHGLACAQAPTEEPIACARTDLDGTYVLAGLPADEYKVEFLAAANLYNLLNQWYDHKPSPAEADFLTLAAGDARTGIDADLEPGAVIRGTVYSAVNGAPLEGIGVCVLSADADGVRGCELTSHTGSYEIFGLGTSSYRVAFSPEFGGVFGEEDDGYPTQYYDNTSDLAAASVLSLVAPEVRSGIDAHLLPDHSPRAVLPSAALPAAVVNPQVRSKPALRCRPGFHKRKVRGKQRCVKVHRHKRHHRGRGNHR